ncbi:DUF5367 family protein [Haladaptatus sp. ZSTT2]|uniref:DUF5367 family protein n=1 Tax=Haladaptatus sp. ZSTT2 TaxID=3120515 RepID=UPI00300E7CB0
MATGTAADGVERTPSLTTPTMQAFFLLGFVVWLVATLAFRVAGQFLLNPNAPLVIGALYVVTVPAMIGLALVFYRWRRVSGAARLPAAIALVLPGMVLDTVVMAQFEAVIPNMVSASAPYFGGMLLLAYASVLLSAFVRRA